MKDNEKMSRRSFLKLDGLKSVFARMTKADKYLVGIIMAFSLSGILTKLFLNNQLFKKSKGSEAHKSYNKYVQIESEKEDFNVPLSEEKNILEIEGPLGISKAKIENGSVEMLESPCPHGTCMQIPPLNSQYGTIACLPNEIIITLEES